MSKNVFLKIATCGVPGAKLNSRIVGGQNAAPHQFPWQVGIFMDNSYFCGGSIICKNANTKKRLE